MYILKYWLLVVWLAAVLPAVAQTTKKSAAESKPSGRFSTMLEIAEPLKRTSQEVNRLRTDLKRATNPELRAEIEGKLQKETARQSDLRKNLLDLIGGAEAAEYEEKDTEGLTLSEQVTDLLQPLLGSLRDASSGPRELEQLKESKQIFTERKRKAEAIIGRVDGYQELVRDSTLAEELKLARKHWELRRAEATGQLGVIESQLEEREKERRPLLETISDMFENFFRSRGLNLLFALLAGIAGYLLVKRLYMLLCRYSPLHRRAKFSLARRIADISAVFLAVLVSVWAVMMVLYFRGDWLLLTLVALMLVGTVWAAKESLPPYVEQIKMLLNLGPVREGERIVHLGLPWRVRKIHFFSVLENPSLQGGELRVPIRHLMEMMSREADPKEPWFPTQVDDWVLMEDGGLHGKVVTQTPEQVVILRLGGSLKTYPSSEFLEQRPENLSHGYRVDGIFGIDYKHQPISTTEVPDLFERALTTALVAQFGRESIRSIKVEFDAAGASSLDYRVLVDVDGSMGSRFQSLKRVIQKVCVDTCNAQGWVIPFTQITIHQAPAEGVAED